MPHQPQVYPPTDLAIPRPCPKRYTSSTFNQLSFSDGQGSGDPPRGSGTPWVLTLNHLPWLDSMSRYNFFATPSAPTQRGDREISPFRMQCSQTIWPAINGTMIWCRDTKAIHHMAWPRQNWIIVVAQVLAWPLLFTFIWQRLQFWGKGYVALHTPIQIRNYADHYSWTGTQNS